MRLTLTINVAPPLTKRRATAYRRALKLVNQLLAQNELDGFPPALALSRAGARRRRRTPSPGA